MVTENTFKCPHCHESFVVKNNLSTLSCPHCGNVILLEEEESIPTGSLLGEFQIIKLYGRNEFGPIYFAYHTVGKSMVLLNALPKASANQVSAIKAFSEQTKDLADFEHPHIIHFFDVREDSGICYCITPYFQGESLVEVLKKEKSLDIKKSLKYVIRIAKILENASNRHGYIHHLINPGNIIINEENDDIYILDLGIEQYYSDQSYQYFSHFYTSPEQTRDEILTWSHDLYSVGVVLYHMLVGAVPYMSDDIGEVYAMHTATAFPDPRTKNKDINLSANIIKLLKIFLGKLPKDRFASWFECQENITKIIGNGEFNLATSKQITTKKSTVSKKPKNSDLKHRHTSKPNAPKQKAISRTSVLNKVKRPKRKKSFAHSIIGMIAILIFTIIIALFIMNINNASASGRRYNILCKNLEIIKKKAPIDYKYIINQYINAMPELKDSKYEMPAHTQLKKLKEQYKEQQKFNEFYDKSYNIIKKGESFAIECDKNKDEYETAVSKFKEGIESIKSVQKEQVSKYRYEKCDSLIDRALFNIDEINKRIARRDKIKKKEKEKEIEGKKKIEEEQRALKLQKLKEGAAEDAKRKSEEARKLAEIKRINKYKKLYIEGIVQLYLIPFNMSKEYKFEEATQHSLFTTKLVDLIEVANEVTNYKLHKRKVLKIVEDADQIYKFIFDSGEKLEGCQILVFKRKYIVVSISDGNITLRKRGGSPDDTKIKKLTELTDDEFFLLLDKARNHLKDVNPIHYYIAIGKLQSAKKIVNSVKDWEQYKTALQEFIFNSCNSHLEKIYFLVQDAETVHQGKIALEKFINDYETLPEFSDVVKKFNEKYPDNRLNLNP